MEKKAYNEMSVEEQTQYIKKLTEFENTNLPALEKHMSSITLPSNLIQVMKDGLTMLCAFSFSKDFALQALRVGDWTRRIYRIRFYLNRIKEELSKGIVVQTADGKAMAYVPSAQQQFARRGRPTREEAARKAAQPSADSETKKQQAIAQMLGLEVVTKQTLREKNNDELRAEREQRQKQQATQNPSIFDIEPSPSKKPPSKIEGARESTPPFPSSFGDGLWSDTPTLAQLSFLLSPELAQRVATVRNLRAQAAAFAEQAKVMAEHGDEESQVAEVAKKASWATDTYEQIYDDVDCELATVYVRLKEDDAFRKAFVEKHYKNMPTLQVSQKITYLEKLLKPYFQKQDKSFLVNVRLFIAENNPEAVAKKNAEKERRDAAEKIIRYLRRTDKKPTPKRIEGMEKKYQELIALIGEEQAKPYYAFITAAKNNKDYTSPIILPSD